MQKFPQKQDNKAENKSTEEPKARFFERIGYNAENKKKRKKKATVFAKTGFEAENRRKKKKEKLPIDESAKKWYNKT